MAKISEAAKAECNRMQNKYKELLQAVEVNIDKMEKELNSIEDEFEIAKNKIDLAVLHIKASSFIATICNISIEYLDIRIENQLNDGRRYINKAIVLLEEALGNYSDDSLSLNEEVHEFLKDKFSDEWRYKFICSFTSIRIKMIFHLITYAFFCI